MKFKNSPKRDVNLDLTPLIDVVFLLLIFFVVTTGFLREALLSVALPEAAGDVYRQEQAPIKVIVNKAGEYAVNTDQFVAMDRKNLVDWLTAVVTDSPQPLAQLSLIIVADADTTHQSVVRVMDIAAELGLTRVSINTKISTRRQR